MERQWQGDTYGSNGMHARLISMLRFIDPRLIYAFAAVFVVPVCLIRNDSRRTAYHYFRQRKGYGRLKAAWKTYTNHCLFSQVVIDKFAMYAGRHFDVEMTGAEHFRRLASQEAGFVQLSAHIGNYEIAGYTLKADKKRFNALVFGGEKESIMENRNKMFKSSNIRMIPISQDMGHLFVIDQALSNGETVSIPGDRINGSKKTVSLPFLGRQADFPQGPFSVATMRGLDVLAVNVMKTSPRKYHIYVTPLAYDKEAARNSQIKELAGRYAAELERLLDMYPEQWYNFFDFWRTENGHA